MPPSVGPRESLALVLLYQAGAHLEALARALGRDGRTVRKVLRQAGVRLRTDPPLPPDWRRDLPRETVAALDAYRTAVAQWHRTAWQQIDQQAPNAHSPPDDGRPGGTGPGSPGAPAHRAHGPVPPGRRRADPPVGPAPPGRFLLGRARRGAAPRPALGPAHAEPGHGPAGP